MNPDEYSEMRPISNSQWGDPPSTVVPAIEPSEQMTDTATESGVS